MAAACSDGQMQTVQYLLSKGVAHKRWQCLGAAAQGVHLSLLKYMTTSEHFGSSDIHVYSNAMMVHAAAGGSMKVLQWLRTNHHVELGASLIRYAAGNNQPAAIQYLRAEG
eukprot:12113-Heterococcus_DN1.PRE.2